MEATPSTGRSRRTGLMIVLFTAVFVAALGATLFTIFYWPPKAKVATHQTPANTLNIPTVSPRLVATGLASPTVITSDGNPSDDRLFVAEQAGLIRVILPEGHIDATPFLDISSKVQNSGEMGLLGLAFHPHYQQNGFLYVNYIDKAQNTVIARYHASPGRAVDPSSEKILFTLKQPYVNHNGGALVFGPDGYLYAALGDGGNSGDPENRAQDKTSYFGKLLRLDIDKGEPYAIPKTNPFVGQAGVKPEIWAYGLRNPWRIGFDSKTGDLYIADVGQGKIEEVDVQKATSKGGENYGWRCYEGSEPYRTGGCGEPSTYTFPIIEYDHTENRCSVTGGYVYRGTKNPGLVGKYFYGDLCGGQLYYASQQDGKWKVTAAAKTPYMISTFGEDSHHELYLADYKTGSIYQLLDVSH